MEIIKLVVDQVVGFLSSLFLFDAPKRGMKWFVVPKFLFQLKFGV